MTSAGASGASVITIVDYGVGNINALLNMFDYLGIEAQISSDAFVLAKADKLVLPGVGAFDKAMSMLRVREIIEPLNEAVLERRTPVLGVCLGMQLLARRSEEGCEAGLGWIEADVRRIKATDPTTYKVPHIGWADVKPVRGSALFDPGGRGERFYFDHAYHVCCNRPQDVAAVFEYETEICCAVSVEHIHGVQFHPEKSHRFGMRLLAAFARSTPMT